MIKDKCPTVAHKKCIYFVWLLIKVKISSKKESMSSLNCMQNFCVYMHIPQLEGSEFIILQRILHRQKKNPTKNKMNKQKNQPLICMIFTFSLSLPLFFLFFSGYTQTHTKLDRVTVMNIYSKHILGKAYLLPGPIIFQLLDISLVLFLQPCQCLFINVPDLPVDYHTSLGCMLTAEFQQVRRGIMPGLHW